MSNDTRTRIIINYNQGKTVKEISTSFDIPISTIKNIIKVYKNEGRVEQKKRGGCGNKKITNSVKEYTDARLDEDSGVSLRILKREILENFNINVSLSAIDKCLKSMNYSFKRVKFVSDASVSEITLDKRKKYSRIFYDLLTQVPDKNIFFIDEVGFCVTMRSKYGTAKIGTTPVCRVPTLRSRNNSICCAMNKTGDIFYKQQMIAFNNETFAALFMSFWSGLMRNNYQDVHLSWIM